MNQPSSQTRVRKGVPTGGQFAASERAEAAVSLDAPAEAAYADIADLAGLVGKREFEGAADHYKADLYAYAKTLPTLDDSTFQAQAGSAIHGSALVSSFRGNWEHEHFKATACHFESNRRKAEAHEEDCEMSTLYERAYNQVVRSQGHSSLARDVRPCTCSGPSSGTPEKRED